MHKYILTPIIVLYASLVIAGGQDSIGIALAKDLIPGANTAAAILSQDEIDGFIQDGKEVVITEKTQVTHSATGGVKKVTEKIRVIDPTQAIVNPDDAFGELIPTIRLGTGDKNSRDYTIVGWQLQQQLKDMYDIKIKPAKSSLINLAGIRDGHLDWAIINADALLYFPNLQLEIITMVDPAYAHIAIQKMNNDDVKDFDDLKANDMMVIGSKHTDSYVTWNVLKSNISQYARIPTITKDGYQALNAVKMRLAQGIFRVCDKQDRIMMKADGLGTLKMINLNNPIIYKLTVRGYPMYQNVTMAKDMYANLLADDSADVIEVTKVLIASKSWFDNNPDAYDNIMIYVEQALANAGMGVRAN